MNGEQSSGLPAPSRRAGVFTLENLKWLIATLVIPAAVWWWSYKADLRAKAALQADSHLSDARQDADELTALLPSLASASTAVQGGALLILQDLVASDPDRESKLKVTLDGIVALAKVQAASGNPEEVKKGVQTVELLAKANPSRQPLIDEPPGKAVAPSMASAEATLPSVVYIQVYSQNQMADATKLSEALRLKGVAVPGIENVLSGRHAKALRYPQRGQVAVRFFHTEDKLSAEGVAALIQQTFTTEGLPSVQFVNTTATSPLGQVEVWLPCRGSSDQASCD